LLKLSDKQFEELVDDAVGHIPKLYRDHLENIAFLVEDDPTPEQRRRLNLYPNETLYGLYEGVPLPQRNGALKLLPDKITIFKNPILRSVQTMPQLKEQIYHTVWHEVAHYYGLDHKRIHQLDGTA